jgi:hypothetical protein
MVTTNILHFCTHFLIKKKKITCKKTTKPKLSSKLYLQAPPLHFTPTKFLETLHEKRRIQIFPPK